MFRDPPGVAVSTVLPMIPVPSLHPPAFELSQGRSCQSSGADFSGQLADTPTRGLPTRGLDDSRTGHIADWSTRGLDNSRTSQLADWTSRGLDNSWSRRCRQKNEN